MSLDSEPKYEALSNCWDSRILASRLRDNEHERAATVNLEAALRRFRTLANGDLLVLWADAICINQDDDDEGSHQVPIMSDIYRSTQKVRAWLSSLPESAADAFGRLVSLTLARPWTGTYNKDGTQRPSCCHDDVLTETRSMLKPGESIASFCHSLLSVQQNPYWARKWIIQGVALAQNFRLHIGHIWIDM